MTHEPENEYGRFDACADTPVDDGCQGRDFWSGSYWLIEQCGHSEASLLVACMKERQLAKVPPVVGRVIVARVDRPDGIDTTTEGGKDRADSHVASGPLSREMLCAALPITAATVRAWNP